MKISIKENPISGVDRYIKSVRTLSLSKNKFWIKSLVMRDKEINTYGLGELKKKAYLRTLFRFIDLLNEAYGDDWDMHVSHITSHKFELCPIILYRNITISNSVGISREINNLVVTFGFGRLANNVFEIDGREYMRLYPKNVEGTRLSMKSDEIISTYRHSHLQRVGVNSQTIMDTTDFCLGSNEVLSTMQQMTTEDDYDPGVFALFLNVLDVMMAWESLEGTPYCYMRSITGNRRLTTAYRYTDDDGKQIYDTIMKYEFMERDFKPTLLLNKNRFRIHKNQYMQDFVKAKLCEKNILKLLVKTGDNGNMVSYVDDTEGVTLNNILGGATAPSTYISGEKFTFHVEDEQQVNDERNLEEYQVNPKFINYVTQQLEQTLLKASIRDKYVAPEYRIVNP